MPDRIAGQTATIYADLPDFTEPVTVTVTDPAGTTVLNAAATTAVGEGRFQATIAANQLTRHGLWTATWSDGSDTFTQRFTVGPDLDGQTKWDLRLQIAGREGLLWEGRVGIAQLGTLIDYELLGSPGNYRGRWVMLHPSAGTALAGVARTVVDFSGNALVLSAPFPSELAPGTRYVLLTVDPDEIDRALRVALRELVDTVRIPLLVRDLPLAEGPDDDELELTVPEGFTHLAAAYNAKGQKLPRTYWHLRPGRKLVVVCASGLDLAAGDTLTLHGSRGLRFPVWEDSQIEVTASSLVAKAALELMATRSGGPAVDVEEHLRRHLIAQQEFESSLARAVDRPQPGLRPVID